MEPLPNEKIEGYLSLSHELFPGSSKNIFVAIADGSNHYLADGISEGMHLVFDQEKPYKAGELSCFMDSGKNIYLRKRKRKDTVYLGRLVGKISAV